MMREVRIEKNSKKVASIKTEGMCACTFDSILRMVLLSEHIWIFKKFYL